MREFVVGSRITGQIGCYSEVWERAGEEIEHRTAPAVRRLAVLDAVDGFEVVYLEPGRLRGHTSAIEDGRAYAVSYEITHDEGWVTREVRVTSDTVGGRRSIHLRSDGQGSWTLDAPPHRSWTGSSTSTSRRRPAPTRCPCTG